MKNDLSLRPIFHPLEKRIEAHVFVAFQACCLHVSRRQRLRAQAPGLTPRAVVGKFAAIQMVAVHFSTTDNRKLIFRRCTPPEKDHKMIRAQLQWELPPQSPPRITAQGEMVEDLVCSATNQALEKIREAQLKEMAGVTGGLNIPGLSDALAGMGM